MENDLTFEIKKPAPEDIIGLWKICFPEDDFFFITDYVFERLSGAAALAQFLGEDCISMVNVIPVRTFYGEDYLRAFFLSGICTHPDFRGRGLSSALLEKVKSMAQSKGADIIQISVPCGSCSSDSEGDALAFFTKAGFKAVSEKFVYDYSRDSFSHFPENSGYKSFVKNSEDVANEEFAALTACYTRNKGDGCFGRSVSDFMVKVNQADKVIFIVHDGNLTGYCLISGDCAYDIFCDDRDSFIAVMHADSGISHFVLCGGQTDSLGDILPQGKIPRLHSTQMALPLTDKAFAFMDCPSQKFNPDNH